MTYEDYLAIMKQLGASKPYMTEKQFQEMKDKQDEAR